MNRMSVGALRGYLQNLDLERQRLAARLEKQESAAPAAPASTAAPVADQRHRLLDRLDKLLVKGRQILQQREAAPGPRGPRR